MQKFDQIYVGGEWTQASGDEHFEVVNASTEEVMGHVPAATAADVDRAVERAAQAFPAWSEAPVEERAAAL